MAMSNVRPDGKRLAAVEILAISAICVHVGVFLLCIWAASGPVDDHDCDVYCGPSSLLVASGLVLLVPITWIAAAAITIRVLVRGRRHVAVVCGVALAIPVAI